jgi:hypothetical protein
VLKIASFWLPCRPVQFSLGNLPTISSFTQKLEAGWEGINENEYFSTDELQKEVEMTTSQDYEKAYIQLTTMRLIKVVQTMLNGRLFSVQCIQNHSKWKMTPFKHGIQKMFKNGTSKFHPHNELVMSMPFDFIDGLKEKDWTAIDKIWLQKLSKHLKHIQSTTIKQIRLIRHIGRDDFYNQSTEYENDDDCYIYVIFQTNNTKFYVNLGQISDIIVEEEWLHGEVNCLCNIASSRIISLSWGAKKKESNNSPNSCFHVGDRVTVTNHRNKWLQLAKICISSGYGIFPSKIISKLSENENIMDWGGQENIKNQRALLENILCSGNKSRVYVSSTSLILRFYLATKVFPPFPFWQGTEQFGYIFSRRSIIL